MGVMPKLVGTTPLHINKTAARLPLRNLRPPLQRKSTDPDTVIDERPDTHRDWERSENLEADPRWSEFLQVARIGEEREDLIARTRQPKLGANGKFRHELSP